MKFCVFWVCEKNKINIFCNIFFRKLVRILYFMIIIRFFYIISKYDVFGVWFNICLRLCFIVLELGCGMFGLYELKFIVGKMYKV